MTLRDDALKLLNAAEAASESGDLEEQHSILITDPETGTKTIVGPYPNGYVALAGMEQLREDYHNYDLDTCTFEVIVTFAPEETA